MRIFRYLARARTKAADEPPGLFQDLDGRVWYRKPDDSEVELGESSGSLPAWWTVDSTPGSESVEFAGAVTIRPAITQLPLRLVFPAGLGGDSNVVEVEGEDAGFVSVELAIDEVGNARLSLYDANEDEFVKLRTGAFSSFIRPTHAAGLVGLDDASGAGIVEVEGSGLLGFFGVSPRVVQQTLGATPTGAEIRAVLVAYGLVAA